MPVGGAAGGSREGEHSYTGGPPPSAVPQVLVPATPAGVRRAQKFKVSERRSVRLPFVAVRAWKSDLSPLCLSFLSLTVTRMALCPQVAAGASVPVHTA